MSKNLLNYEGLEYFLSKLLTYIENQRTVKNVDTTASNGINLSNTNGTLDVTVTPGSVANGDTGLVTGDAVYDAIQAQDAFIVNLTLVSSELLLDGTALQTLSTDKDTMEVWAAVNSGKLVYAVKKGSTLYSYANTYRLSSIVTENGVGVFAYYSSISTSPIGSTIGEPEVTYLLLYGTQVLCKKVPLARLISPLFTGTPTAPTATTGTNTTQIATTAFVNSAIENNYFIVTGTYNNNVLTADKTALEVYEAVLAGKLVYLVINTDQGIDYYLPYQIKYLGGNIYFIIYSALNPNSVQPNATNTTTSSTAKVTFIGHSGTTLNKVDFNVANLNSPTFTGEPKAPTPTAGDDSTKIATTAFVQDVADTKEDVSNKVTSLSSSSTDTLYPSAKAVYELVNGYDYSLDYFTIEALEDGDVKFVFGSSVTTDDMTSMSYSLDNGDTWTLIENLNNKAEDLVTTISVTSGDCILWKGIGNTMCHVVNGSMSMSPYNKMSHFESTNGVNVKGNIMSLVFGDNYKNQLSLQDRPYCFGYLFSNASSGFLKIIDASNFSLAATTLALSCYYYMFNGCTSLTTAPTLPATTLAEGCYIAMFQGCTSLTTAPQLPTTTLFGGCYTSMFQGCTSLITAPELPAMTAARDCYFRMFNGCTSLTTAPSLPATTLNSNCYWGMFKGCTSLTTAPSLPATTLTGACYSSMFDGCTSLTTAPQLQATTLADSCYSSMFKGCTSLTQAPQLLATTLKTFCYSNMFQDCTSLTTAPQLPATTLAISCYGYMFNGCTALTQAPELPATGLVKGCYNYMFNGCTNLNYIKAMFTTTPETRYTSNWVSGVAASGTFIKSSAAAWDVTGLLGIPSGWNVCTENEYEVVRHYELATTSANGLMSSSDKTKLDGIAAGAQVNVVTSVNTTASTSGINLSLSNLGELDVSIARGSITSGVQNFVTGDTVYLTTSLLAPKASPALTGTPTAPTAELGTNNTQIATTAFVTQTVANALIGKAAFQGTVDSLSDIPNVYKKGYHWLVLTAGTYFTQVCEVGDIIYCVADSDATHEASWSIEKDFTVILNNLDIAIISNAEIDNLFTTESSNDSSNNG